MTITPVHLLIAASAGWRLASLLANEAGMFGMFYHARRFALRLTLQNRFWRAFKLYDGVTCEWCNSVWFGGLISALWLTFGDRVILALLPLAISTWVILFKYLLQAVKQADEYLDGLNKARRDQPEDYQPVTVPEHSFL